jgi:hypothetical protein
VTSAIGSSDRVIAADDSTAGTLADWLGDDDTRGRCDTWSFDATAAAQVAEACRLALARRRGEV